MAKMIPIIPVVVKCSLNISVPIRIVASRLKTDQMAPTIESWFFCKIAGSHESVPSEYIKIIKIM